MLYVFPCVILLLCFSVLLLLRLPRLGKRELILVLSYVCSVCACLDLSVSSSSWGLGRAAACDCGTPWTFLLTFLNFADIHCAIKEVRCRPGETIARLTLLGWTKIGNPSLTDETSLQTFFTSTYTVKDLLEIEQLNANLKKVLGNEINIACK